MPYIKPEEREKWKGIIKDISIMLREIPPEQQDGELNYLITSILKKTYSPKYYNYNRAIGVLECIKQEFYRRDIGAYENKKIRENGDV